jgi:lipopolysaccharide transport system ATP-binding protein
MSSDVSIEVEGVSKAYALYARPVDRLKQMVVPRLRRAIGREPRRYYDEFWALRDASFTVRRGETVGIVGRNGSGKSTLLQIICGTLQPTFGQVTTRGRIAALLELGAGFNPEFTGIENVLLSAQLLGLSRAEAEAALPQIEAFAEIGDFIRQPVKTYSSGMFVRLAFAAQAFVQPDILVVDEALAVGDMRFQAKCLGRLDELRAGGTSILFVSHDTTSVRRFCDRAVWIDSGRVRRIGDVGDVTSAYVEFMFTRPADAAAPAPEAAAPAEAAGDGAADPGSAEPAAAAPAGALGDAQLIGAPGHVPLRRWGSRQGLIRAALVMDGDGGRELLEVRLGQPMQVVIHAALPEDMDPAQVCVSFSIKNAKSQDVVAASSWDDPGCRFAPGQRAAVLRFRLENWLNDGDYHLVATIEDRSGLEFHYLDYVDGAAYIRSNLPQVRWGIFVPPVRVEMDAADAPAG